MSTPPPLRILAFEPFDAGSHRAVRESIARHSRHAWAWVTLPGRAWKWRMRLGALELLERARASGALNQPVDAIFATSLMSLADLVAGLPAGLRAVPTVLYMHENQAAYPASASQQESPEVVARDVHFALTNLTSIHAADLVVWNSAWNRRSFDAEITRILEAAPEAATRSVAGSHGAARHLVIWPPVEATAPSAGAERTARVLHNATRVVWPHRWEHDKGPDDLLELAREHTEKLNLRWTILGERYRRVPPALAEFERVFADRIDAFGFEPDRTVYLDHLRRCDWVLSTALHEFFGVAVVEALLCGCLPWLPDRLSYPELLPEPARGLSPLDRPEDPGLVRDAIRAHLRPAVASEATESLDQAVEGLCGRPRP